MQGFADTKSTYHAASQSGGNFGFLVDLGGEDQYGTDAANDRVTKRGDGFIIDR